MKNVILWAMLAVFFFGCNQNKNNHEENPIETNSKQLPDTINQSVLLFSEPNALMLDQLPANIQVTMTNNTNDTITTGLHYHIEHFEEKKWTKVSPDQLFNDLGYILLPGKSEEFNVKLLQDQIAYNKGKYRIVKYYLKSDYQKTRQDFHVYAEFNIE